MLYLVLHHWLGSPNACVPGVCCARILRSWLHVASWVDTHYLICQSKSILVSECGATWTFWARSNGVMCLAWSVHTLELQPCHTCFCLRWHDHRRYLETRLSAGAAYRWWLITDIFMLILFRSIYPFYLQVSLQSATGVKTAKQQKKPCVCCSFASRLTES